MQHWAILRANTSLQGTPGTLYSTHDGITEFAKTIELPWRDNQRGISCIPSGRYEVELTWSPRYKKPLYLVKDVEKRSGIRIHSANYAGAHDFGYRRDLLGCIALGRTHAHAPQLMVTSSRVTMKKFHEVADKEFLLTIIGDLQCPVSLAS